MLQGSIRRRLALALVSSLELSVESQSWHSGVSQVFNWKVKPMTRCPGAWCFRDWSRVPGSAGPGGSVVLWRMEQGKPEPHYQQLPANAGLLF